MNSELIKQISRMYAEHTSIPASEIAKVIQQHKPRRSKRAIDSMGGGPDWVYNQRPLSDLFSFSGDPLKYVVSLLQKYSQEVTSNYFGDDVTTLGAWTVYNVKMLPFVYFLKNYLIKNGHQELVNYWLNNYAGMMKYLDELKMSDHNRFITYASFMASSPCGLVDNLTTMFPTKFKLEHFFNAKKESIFWGTYRRYLCDVSYFGFVNDHISDLMTQSGLYTKVTSEESSYYHVLEDTLGVRQELDQEVIKTWTKIASSVDDSPSQVAAEAYGLLKEVDMTISDLIGVAPDSNSGDINISSSALANWKQIDQLVNKLSQTLSYAHYEKVHYDHIVDEVFSSIMSGMLIEYTVGIDKSLVGQYISMAVQAWNDAQAMDNNFGFSGHPKCSAPYYKNSQDRGNANIIVISEVQHDIPGIGGDPETGFTWYELVVDTHSGTIHLGTNDRIADVVPNYPKHGTKLAAYPVAISHYGNYKGKLRTTTFDECFTGSNSPINATLKTITDLDELLSLVNMSFSEIDQIIVMIDKILSIFD